MTNYSIGGSSGTTGLSELTEPLAAGDKIPLVNVSDTTTAPAGSAGSDQYMTASVLGQAIRGTVNAVLDYGADPTGGADSTTAIQTALLSFGTLGGWSQGQGGVVFLPAGQYLISKTLIIPSGVTLKGTGWGSQLTLVTNSNCDMVQTACDSSTSQATILGVSASAITNAFWAGIRDMALHGDAFHATIAGYNHGINVTTNPLTSSAGADPDFDPMFTTENVRVEACTGDGYFHSGRSGAFLKRCWMAYNNGNGFTFSFDTTAIDLLAEGNNCGVYLNHGSNTGAGCKSYNNNDNTWVASTSYSPGNTVVSAGVMYFCILAVSGSTAPASDATHWTALSTATSPQATGYDWYFDTGAGGHYWAAVESQEPSRGGFYFKGPNAGPISVDGQCENVNFNNGQPDYDGANPNHYAAVTLDGVSGVNFKLNSSAQGGGAGIVCTSLNSPGANTLIATTDLTETALFNGGTPGFALVNGQFQSPVTGLQSVTSGVQTLTFSSTLAPNAALGDHFAVTLTGNATMSAPTNPPSGSALSQKITFELIQDSTGGRTVTWNSAFNFGTTGAPTLSAATKRDLIGFVWSPSASKWQYAGTMPGL